jgi:hypothetical protein
MPRLGCLNWCLELFALNTIYLPLILFIILRLSLGFVGHDSPMILMEGQEVHRKKDIQIL